jgi:hypothetical protein
MLYPLTKAFFGPPKRAYAPETGMVMRKEEL